MKNFKEDDLSSNQKQFVEFLENASNQTLISKEQGKFIKSKEKIHLNSLITKNISLFTKNPNYKMLAWLITQLLIFSLFVLAMSIFKNNLIPYLNSLQNDGNNKFFILKFLNDIQRDKVLCIVFLINSIKKTNFFIKKLLSILIMKNRSLAQKRYIYDTQY